MLNAQLPHRKSSASPPKHVAVQVLDWAEPTAAEQGTGEPGARAKFTVDHRCLAIWGAWRRRRQVVQQRERITAHRVDDRPERDMNRTGNVAADELPAGAHVENLRRIARCDTREELAGSHARDGSTASVEVALSGSY